MRPGSLSRQYKDPSARTGAYWQLSYTHNMRSRTRYVRPEEVPTLKPLLLCFHKCCPFLLGFFLLTDSFFTDNTYRTRLNLCQSFLGKVSVPKVT